MTMTDGTRLSGAILHTSDLAIWLEQPRAFRKPLIIIRAHIKSTENDSADTDEYDTERERP